MNLNLPGDEESGDDQSQIISLIIKQVADNSVVPFHQIFPVWFPESLPAGEEVAPRSERHQLHSAHYSCPAP